MILIFGGAYQGKLDYARERFGDDVFRCSADSAALPGGRRIIYEIDKWILALVRGGIETSDAARKFIEENGDAVVICNDISCGVVPTDPELRCWREAVGRILAVLAVNSSEVIRLFCGIPTRIR